MEKTNAHIIKIIIFIIASYILELLNNFCLNFLSSILFALNSLYDSDIIQASNVVEIIPELNPDIACAK